MSNPGFGLETGNLCYPFPCKGAFWNEKQFECGFRAPSSSPGSVMKSVTNVTEVCLEGNH